MFEILEISAWRVDIDRLQNRDVNVIRIQILALTSCVILGEIFNYFLPQFLYL